jgi:prepilin-type N-terminal cleavage/methylation domain-containing protein
MFCHTTHKRQAFTLLEVILALLVMALVMAAVSPALIGALRAQRQVYEVLEPLAFEQAAFARLSEDVQAAPQSAETTAALLSLSTTINGGQSTPILSLFSDLPLPLPPNVVTRAPDMGQAEITWSVVQQDSDTLFSLVRAVDANVLASGSGPTPLDSVMLRNLAFIEMDVLDGGSWYTTFDSFTLGYFPRALRVTYAYALKNGQSGPRRSVIIDLPQTALSAPTTVTTSTTGSTL